MSLPVPTVRESWARIDAWLVAHAPGSFALLAPPADPEQIEAAQKEMVLRFPPELIQSLACHDGLRAWANMFPGKPPLSTGAILNHWRMCMEIAEDNPDLFEPITEDVEPWWHPQWIPWAESDGDSQIIDMRDGPHQGRMGTALHDDSGSFEDGWPSLAAYLNDVAEALDEGGAVGPWAPFLTSDGELWWDFSGETELDGEPLVPAPASKTA